MLSTVTVAPPAEAGYRHRSIQSLSISGTPSAAVVAGNAYAFTPTVRSSGGTLMYAISNKPVWALFSSTTGVLSGTPTSLQVGTSSNIIISVSDGTRSAALASFSITVSSPVATAPAPTTSTNTAPTISGVPAGTATAGTSYSFQPSANDANGDMLGFSIVNKPAWAIFNTATGQLTGTPSSLQTGSYASIGISVTDGKATTSLPTFAITVASAVATATAQTTPPGTGSTLVTSVAGGGIVTSTGGTPDLNCRSTGGTGCTGAFPGGTGVLTAVADPGYSFVGWRSQDATSYSGCTSSPCTVTKPLATEYLTAVFEKSAAINPVVLYTDITSGPNNGGENNDGAYLTVFGKNFGSGALGSTIKVYVNDVEVKRYIGTVPGTARGRTDIQQIAVQIGSLGRPAATAGTAPSAALKIKVIADGRLSNPAATVLADPTFVVNPGNIYFVNNVTGVDTTTTTTGGTFAAPFKSVQLAAGAVLGFSLDSASNSGAWGRVRAGDFIVMRGTGTNWTGKGFLGYFLQTLNKSGCALGTNCAQGGGTSSGPITVMGYPGEDVFINGAYDASGATNGAVSSADSARIGQGFGFNINIINLRVEGGNYDGAVNTQAGGSYWRVVNNELTAATAVNAVARAGGIHGAGNGHFWVGNYIHDVYCGPNGTANPLENHGIYIGDTGSYEIAYNHIARIYGGSGIQTHIGGSALSVDNVSFHHNLVHDVNKHGINLADGARNNIRVWNNIVYNTVQAGLRMGGTSMLKGALIYNNVFYNTNLEKNAANGALTNDMVAAPGQVDIRNNIIWPSTGTLYNNGSNNSNFSGGIGIIRNNLWFGGSNAVPTFDTASRTGNPLFVSATQSPVGSNGFYFVPSNISTLTPDFHLFSGSPAVDTGDSGVTTVAVDDYDIASAGLARTLRPGTAVDIGTYER